MEEQDHSIPSNYVYADAFVQTTNTFTSRENHPSFSSARPQFQVQYKFSAYTFCSYWITPQDSTEEPRFLSEVSSLLIETPVLMNFDQLMCYGKASDIILRGLNDWPVRGEWCHKLIDYAVKEGRRAIMFMPPSHNVVHLHLCVDMVYRHFLNERHVINWMLEQSMQENEVQMVPASDSAIEALESMEVSRDSRITCPICLEEFVDAVGGCQAVRMPCSHAFHAECIKKWLRTSHYCPVCRFEMPTN